jgi:hypothetical protein
VLSRGGAARCRPAPLAGFEVPIMHFSRKDQLYQVSRITGPTHNLLRLQLDMGVVSPAIEVERLPSFVPGAESRLQSAELTRQVLLGISEANAEFASDYCASKIFYVPDDTPVYDVYRHLARCIVSRIVKGEDFHALT